MKFVKEEVFPDRHKVQRFSYACGVRIEFPAEVTAVESGKNWHDADKAHSPICRGCDNTKVIDIMEVPGSDWPFQGERGSLAR